MAHNTGRLFEDRFDDGKLDGLGLSHEKGKDVYWKAGKGYKISQFVRVLGFVVLRHFADLTYAPE